MAAADWKVVFRILGGLAILAAMLCVIAFFANSRARHSGGHDISSVIYLGAFFAVVGVGLLSLRKIAALLFCVPLVALGLSMIVGSIFQVPFPWLLINIGFGLVMLLPAWITFRGWGALTKWI
jgi:hypothetical protein